MEINSESKKHVKKEADSSNIIASKEVGISPNTKDAGQRVEEDQLKKETEDFSPSDFGVDETAKVPSIFDLPESSTEQSAQLKKTEDRPHLEYKESLTLLQEMIIDMAIPVLSDLQKKIGERITDANIKLITDTSARICKQVIKNVKEV